MSVKFKCPYCGEFTTLSGGIFNRYFFCPKCRIIIHNLEDLERKIEEPKEDNNVTN